MKNVARVMFLMLAAAAVAIAVWYAAVPKKPERLALVPLFPTESAPSLRFDAGIVASPLLDLSQGTPRILLPVSDGTIVALDPETGAPLWQTVMPAPVQQQPYLMATPVQIGDRLVVVYQNVEANKRVAHRVAVVDLGRGELDPAFPVIDLSAEKPAAGGQSTVKFNPPFALSHAALQHAEKPGSELGFVYAAFGNSADIQPWHGWLFEIDMDAWRETGGEKAVSATLVTTPESECPVEGQTGSRDMICGGGIWAPAGPPVFAGADGYELIVPTGNGQIDLARGDYSNTLMRVKQGLQFDPGCDAALCAGFDPANPSAACIESCKNLFIPRLAPGNLPLRPASGECDDKTFWECLAWNDYDLGANAPVKVDLQGGPSVLVQPGKEGAVYLIDAGHLGTLYDRLQIAEICGTKTDKCRFHWRGMIVTRPALTYDEGTPIVVVPTFMSDNTQPAGLVALKIVLENGRPKFERHWQVPDPKTPGAAQRFRSHPSLPVVAPFGADKDPYVWVVDVGGTGVLFGVRVEDGAVVVEASLSGTGRPLSYPLIYNGRIYLPSNSPDRKASWLEAYRIVEPEPARLALPTTWWPPRVFSSRPAG